VDPTPIPEAHRWSQASSLKNNPVQPPSVVKPILNPSSTFLVPPSKKLSHLSNDFPLSKLCPKSVLASLNAYKSCLSEYLLTIYLPQLLGWGDFFLQKVVIWTVFRTSSNRGRLNGNLINAESRFLAPKCFVSIIIAYSCSIWHKLHQCSQPPINWQDTGSINEGSVNQTVQLWTFAGDATLWMRGMRRSVASRSWYWQLISASLTIALAVDHMLDLIC